MDKKRVYLLDEIRGFAILCMVVYHLMFDLRYLHGVPVPIFFEDWFNIIRDIFAGIFIFISGSVCRYSHNNLKRGIQCFFLGMILTFVTAFATPSAPIYFGILHMLGICMILFALAEPALDKIPTILGLLLTVVLFILLFSVPNHSVGIPGLFSFAVPDMLYDAKLLFPLGFPGTRFASGDYFPLIPWFFLFLAGSYFGLFIRSGVMPAFFYKPHFRPLGFVGRNTIWIYLLHQPVIFVALNLIFKGTVF